MLHTGRSVGKDVKPIVEMFVNKIGKTEENGVLLEVASTTLDLISDNLDEYAEPVRWKRILRNFIRFVSFNLVTGVHFGQLCGRIACGRGGFRQSSATAL